MRKKATGRLDTKAVAVLVGLLTITGMGCSTLRLGTAAGCKRAALSRDLVETPAPGFGESRVLSAVRYDHRAYQACQTERAEERRRRNRARALAVAER